MGRKVVEQGFVQVVDEQGDNRCVCEEMRGPWCGLHCSHVQPYKKISERYREDIKYIQMTPTQVDIPGGIVKMDVDKIYIDSHVEGNGGGGEQRQKTVGEKLLVIE